MLPERTTPSGLLDRVSGIIAKRLSPVVQGFYEHGWSGRLYLLTSALGIVTTGGMVLFTAAAALLGLGGVPRGAGVLILPVSLMLVLTTFIQWKVLRGVACFKRWAWYVAVFFSTAGVLSGIAWLLPGRMNLWRLAGLCELALAGQFLLYFVRNRTRFDQPIRMPAVPSERGFDGESEIFS